MPASYTASAPMPLLIVLHGYSMSGDAMESVFQLEPVAEQRGFLYVHPDGTRDVDGYRFWNATDGCCNPGDLPVDDSAYLAAVIEQVRATYRVDERQIYLLGASNGGFMSYRMACDHADQVAAIVSLSGAMWSDTTRCTPSEPVSVLQIHGTVDDIIPYEGGRFIDEPFPSATATVEGWAAYDGCEPDRADASSRLDLDANLPGDETEVARFAGCAAGTDVELWTVTGGSHIFQFTPTAIPSILDFLFAHPKP